MMVKYTRIENFYGKIDNKKNLDDKIHKIIKVDW